MSISSTRVSTRARLMIAAVSMGAIAIAALVVLGRGSGSQIGGSIRASEGATNPQQLRQEAISKIAALPLYFEVNQGQVDPSVRFLSRNGRYSLFLTDDAAVFSLMGGQLHKNPVSSIALGK